MTDTKPLVVWTTCHPWIQEVVAEVQPDEFDVEFLDLNDADAVAATLPRVDALICLSLTTEQCRMLDRCKLVMHNGVGYDAIDIETLAEMGIPVAVTPVMTPEGVAEHALMLILALSKQLPAVQQSMKSGEWNMLGWREGSHNLSYKTLGIIGLGRIGEAVAMRAKAFGMNIIYNKRSRLPASVEDELGVTFEPDIDRLVARSDIITLHCPLTADTDKIINAERIAHMKPNAYVINSSRGELIDEDALIEALQSGRIAGAGLDVYTHEPAVDSRFLSIPNAVLLPHLGSATVEGREASGERVITNIRVWADGHRPPDQVLEGWQ